MALSGDGGKGYGRRPQLAPNEVVESNWERIFGTKNPKIKEQKSKETKPKKDKKKKMNGEPQPLLPLQRRTFPKGM